MPRRHNRDADQPEPLAVTPADIPKPPLVRRRERMVRRDKAAEYRRIQEEAARRKRVAAAVDWTVCMVPGCDEPFRMAYRDKDVDQTLPICTHHAVIVKRQIDPQWDDAEFRTYRKRVQAHHEQVQDAYQRAAVIRDNGDSYQGQLYFLRLNGLIKVGWSSNLEQRLKAYGPDVQILCHYPGSRDDETHMHRQLRPYLAKGREWYTDCKLIEDVVADIIKRHGPPTISAYWTKPKPEPIKRRRSA